jgi:hypothetical protein
MGTRYAKQLIDRDAAAAILDRWPVEGQGSSLQTRCLTFQTATLLRCQRGNREVNCQRKVPVRICWQAYARCFPRRKLCNGSCRRAGIFHVIPSRGHTGLQSRVSLLQRTMLLRGGGLLILPACSCSPILIHLVSVSAFSFALKHLICSPESSRVNVQTIYLRAPCRCALRFSAYNGLVRGAFPGPVVWIQ